MSDLLAGWRQQSAADSGFAGSSSVASYCGRSAAAAPWDAEEDEDTCTAGPNADTDPVTENIGGDMQWDVAWDLHICGTERTLLVTK